jgi:predicted O-methyltransferase YrrM
VNPALGRLAADARFVKSMRGLAPRVALFMWRARRVALNTGDEFSIASAIRPAELATLIELAREARVVFELGTGTAWSALALAVADRRRRIVTYDPSVRAERERYLALVSANDRERIEFRAQPDSDGPLPGEAVDLLFVDSSHERDAVLLAFRAWSDSLRPGAVVAFHDYGHPSYPGVREAIEELGLNGHAVGGLFVWRAGPDPSSRGVPRALADSGRL